jgi:hypothetical protein
MKLTTHMKPFPRSFERRYQALKYTVLGGALLAACSNTFGATYHVSPSGNDGNPGTQAAPWKTIGMANRTLVAGDTVLIHAGTYGDQIRPARSGTSDSARIVYRVYGDGDVILTGFPGAMGPGEGAIALGLRTYVTVDGAAPNIHPAHVG